MLKIVAFLIQMAILKQIAMILITLGAIIKDNFCKFFNLINSGLNYSDEECNIANGPSLIKFDISSQTVLTEPPLLLIDVLNILYLTNIYRTASSGISYFNLIP